MNTEQYSSSFIHSLPWHQLSCLALLLIPQTKKKKANSGTMQEINSLRMDAGAVTPFRDVIVHHSGDKNNECFCGSDLLDALTRKLRQEHRRQVPLHPTGGAVGTQPWGGRY